MGELETTINQLPQILKRVQKVVKQQQELIKLKGENFNIFSILQMETKENATHSAFLGELLNPEGSHWCKAIFLKHFLTAINYKGGLDPSTARVELEKHIGKVDIENKAGGRIDIYITDTKGNSISIENKLYAPEQPAQVERYHNHNKAKNTVYYLTLKGSEPSDKSSGQLKDGTGYHCISYAHTIVKWLSQCRKEAVDQPILRETIGQYILLIKKLTNQLSNDDMEDQVLDIIKKNYQAAKLLADNVWKSELERSHAFLKEIEAHIKPRLGEDCYIEVSEDLNEEYTGLYISYEDWNGIGVKLEGQRKIPWHNSIYGITAAKDRWNRGHIDAKLKCVVLLQSGFKSSYHWPYYQNLLGFGNSSEREKLFDTKQRLQLVESVAERLIELVQLCREPLRNIPTLT